MTLGGSLGLWETARVSERRPGTVGDGGGRHE